MRAKQHISQFAVNGGWNQWYKNSADNAQGQFETYLKPIFAKYTEIRFDNVLDFACGEGKIANQIIPLCKNLTCCDVNADAINFCIDHFKNEPFYPRMKFVTNKLNGYDPVPVPFSDEEFTFVFSWDAMVHFTYKWLDYYFSEFYRILQKDGYAVIHHSNFGNYEDGKTKSENFMDNQSWRTLVTANDVRFIAEKHRFTVVEQQIITWGGKVDLDCITILTKK